MNPQNPINPSRPPMQDIAPPQPQRQDIPAPAQQAAPAPQQQTANQEMQAKSMKPVVMKKSGMAKKFFTWLLVLLLIAGAGAGAYFWQQRQIDDLNQQLTSSQTQLKVAQTSAKEAIAKSEAASQQTTRDTERQADIQALSTQLDTYFTANKHYPSLTNLNDSSWRTTNMKAVDTKVFADPSSPTIVQLADKPAAKVYAYAATDKAGATCEADNTKCTKYTLTATLEVPVNGSTTYTKQNP
jgi:hypothetical protein